MRAEAGRLGLEDSGTLDIDITEARSFAVLDNYGRGGRDIRVSARLRPGIVCPLQAC